jgi:hypothetical protein
MEATTPSFVIPSEVEGSAVPSTSIRPGWKQLPPSFVLPSEPRISYYAAKEMASCAAFIEESRMKFADPTKLDRKSGEVEGSAVST